MNDADRIAQLETTLRTLVDAIDSPQIYIYNNIKTLAAPLKEAQRVLGIVNVLPTIQIIDTPTANPA